MATITQDNRLLGVTSVLGEDVLLLQSFNGHEAISRLFSYQLELLSEDDAIAAKDLVGTKITWLVRDVDKEPRYFNGVVNRMVAGGMDARNLRAYRVEVVPWLWFLTRTANCRIFQNKSTPDIIKAIFADLGLFDYSADLIGTYHPREYCVQYRETAFNFISRLMEQDGIFYFFRHENGKHTMVLADSQLAFQDCVENQVSYSGGTLAPNYVASWEHQYEYRSGRWSQTDYNFETPCTSLLESTDTLLQFQDISGFEIFDYPGDYMKKADGIAEIKIRMEEEEAPSNMVVGSSQCSTFTPGGKFTLEDHEVDSEIGGYVITSILHSATDTSYSNTSQGAEYRNTFTCIPDKVAYRAPRITPKPVVQGPQTAVVVGPSGEEIYVDKYGRVKVHFFWDRLGHKDEHSSCWMRVAQHWAGKDWGVIFNPRIGQEVMVEFLEGDPDRPIITGRVYNAEQMPPYDLPANRTQSGVKTRSSQGGSPDNFNEIRFEDKKGSEQLFIHAEKDQDIEVEHDETHWVGHDRTKTIDHDETAHIMHDRTETVDNNETITIHGNQTETVDKDETITIGVDRTEHVKGNESITIDGGRTESVGINESIIIIGGRTTSVSKDESLSVGGGRSQNISKSDTLTVGKTLVINAVDSIMFQTGAASIVMQKNGDINISGKSIVIATAGEKT